MSAWVYCCCGDSLWKYEQPDVAARKSANMIDDRVFISRRASIQHHTANRFSLVHQGERVVDFFQRHRVRDQIVDVDFLVHIPFDDFWYIAAAFRAAECGPFPRPSRHELERTR